ncbi:MAG TPA: DUF4097 family beta strand repeat-containing protein [Opitutaceae bacterium]|nr:DUF4097 family beta strand repeat-containing protein [Opitutaceae bacterium]
MNSPSRSVALGLILLFTAAFARAGYDFKETFTRAGAFDSTGAVVLENVNGNIDIRTWDKNEILIEGEKSAKTGEELALIDLQIELSAERAAIEVRLPKRAGGLFSSNGNIRAAVRFKITVPKNAVLEKISGVNGSVALEDIRGSVNAGTVNGGVKASNLGGDAKLATVNGAIDAGFSHVTAEQKLSFNTVNGQVVVRLPKDAGAVVRGSVVNGGISCDFPLTLGTAKGRNISGTIGDGRASLKAETVNGRVHIESI